MRVLVTGATGFVGGWMLRELAATGHEPVAAPPSAELDIADEGAVRALVDSVAPAAIVHLASPARSSEAETDAAAERTHLGGMVAITEAARRQARPPSLLVISSAEVYAAPSPGMKLTEASPVAPRTRYGVLKLAAESIAVASARRFGLPLVVLRPFGHVGPGQRAVSAVASFAARVAAVRRGELTEIEVGNLDVARDIGDVRDYVRAYRLVLERMATTDLGHPPEVLNVATGAGVELRAILDELCRMADVSAPVRVDPALVRADDPPWLVGDASRLMAATGWRPEYRLSATLADVLAEHLISA